MAPLFSGASTSKTKLEAGAVIASRYRLEQVIGWGGMGIVYRARDISADRLVAIKVINLDEGFPGAREKFLREAQITLQLKHPHIVAVHEVGAVDTGAPVPAPFIAMEFVAGPSLDKLRDLTISQALELGKQICDALEYAHARGYVHRDLKPENILVERRGLKYFAKLGDFGLARPRDVSNLGVERTEGTVYYLAPEVIAGQPADIPADLYALGAMLYQMVTGLMPFSDFDEQGILTQHLEEPVKPPSESRDGIPPALEEVILRLLAKNPAERFASAREVGEALEQIQHATERLMPEMLLASPQGFTEDEDETLCVKQLLESNRLVTLLGDKSHKTSLALAVGAKLMEEFSDGVWLIDLETVRDPAAVPGAVASILNAPKLPDRTTVRALIEYLGEKNVLLILDKCDHLRRACAQLVETVLATCPEICVLANLCEPMNLSSEATFNLERP